MIRLEKSLPLYIIINLITLVSLVSIQELPKMGTMININKGYALRRIGTYSPNVVEQIVHTFIPFDQFCVMSPDTDVCVFTSQWTKTNVVEVATIMSSHHTVRTKSTYNTDSISRLIRKDISQVLTQHHPNEIININKSVLHFVNNQFYHQKNDKEALVSPSIDKAIDNYCGIIRVRTTPIQTILNQISRNTVGFEYLSDRNLKFFLTTIFSNIDTPYTFSNVQESLDIFTQLIVGQSIFALRHCSFSRPQNSSPVQPCLAVSTLFLRTPADSASVFSVYRLIPLPTVVNGDKYIYSNLPKLIGLNTIDQTLVMWNDESNDNECTFSTIVQCQKKPPITPLSHTSCLYQLLDHNQLTTSKCQVSQSQDIDQDVMYIDNGIWLFYNVQHARYCHVYSASEELNEMISINEAALIHIPCNSNVTCMGIQLSSSLCTQHRTTITPTLNSFIQDTQTYIQPIQLMTQTIISSYQSQLEHSINTMTATIRSKQSRFKRFSDDFLNYILSVVCLIVVTIIAYIFKYIKYKLQRKVHDLEAFFQQLALRR